MTKPVLVIGNKLYSSWSLRPWLLMKVCGVLFEEQQIPLFHHETKAEILKHSPSGKVPVLIDGDVRVWESLAIFEYLGDTHPDVGIWPADVTARAYARAVSAEIHAGFAALREACPMNLGKRFPARDRGAAVAGDAARIATMIRDMRARLGNGGSFLFGEFCAADAMLAPILTRLETYSIDVDDECNAYRKSVLSLSAFQEWRVGALKEPWVIKESEVQETPLEDYRRALQ